MLDKRPALEYLVGIDRNTGAYIPELAEKWEMAPDGKSWTLRLRQGVKFHEKWGEFTAKDVRHSIFLISQPESSADRCRALAHADGYREERLDRGGGETSRADGGDRQ